MRFLLDCVEEERENEKRDRPAVHRVTEYQSVRRATVNLGTELEPKLQTAAAFAGR